MGCEQPPRAWPCPTSQALSLITFSTLPQFSFCSLDEQGSVHFWALLPLSPTTCVLDTFPLPFKISFDLLHPLHAWMAEALVGCIKSLVESIKSCGLPSSPLLSVGPLREAGSWGAGDKWRWVSISQLHPSQIVGAHRSSWPSPMAGLSFSVF